MGLTFAFGWSTRIARVLGAGLTRASDTHTLPRAESMLFFFQAEDGIRYDKVTGVQTCALPIRESHGGGRANLAAADRPYRSILSRLRQRLSRFPARVGMGAGVRSVRRPWQSAQPGIRAFHARP